jgi:hypothetical protein
MVGVPARSAEDAILAIDWLVKENAELGVKDWENPPIPCLVVASVVNAVRHYIGSTKAVVV